MGLRIRSPHLWVGVVAAGVGFGLGMFNADRAFLRYRKDRQVERAARTFLTKLSAGDFAAAQDWLVDPPSCDVLGNGFAGGCATAGMCRTKVPEYVGGLPLIAKQLAQSSVARLEIHQPQPGDPAELRRIEIHANPGSPEPGFDLYAFVAPAGYRFYYQLKEADGA